MKIGILQTGKLPDELIATHEDYDQRFVSLLQNAGFDFETYLVVDDVLPNSIDEADGWLITGSKYGVYENHSWIPPLEQFIRDAYQHSIPIVGICFGHQIIAQALGGKVVAHPKGWAVGSIDYTLADNNQKITLNAWHQDQVIMPPKNAITIASNDFCQHAALLYTNKALTWQPHPEFSNDYILALLDSRDETLAAEVVDQAKASINGPISSDLIAQQIIEFYRQSR